MGVRLARAAVLAAALGLAPFAARAADSTTAISTTAIKTVSAAGARQTIEAAKQAADKLRAPCAIAVVDASGILVLFEKMDGVRAGSPDLAIGKARTAALLQRPSQEVEDNIDNGRVAFTTAGLLSLRGGVPLVADGEVVGAVGVASLSKDNDVLIAKAAAQGFAEGLAKH